MTRESFNYERILKVGTWRSGVAVAEESQGDCHILRVDKPVYFRFEVIIKPLQHLGMQADIVVIHLRAYPRSLRSVTMNVRI